MITKQLLFSVLILGNIANIALGINNKTPYKFPQLPQQQCDFCDLDIERYKKEYNKATAQMLEFFGKDIQENANKYNINVTPGSIAKAQYVVLIAATTKLNEDLSYIKKQQKLCPAEYITLKRNKKIENAIEIGFNQ